MTVTYQYSQEDYIKAGRLHLKHFLQRHHKLLLLGMFIFLLLLSYNSLRGIITIVIAFVLLMGLEKLAFPMMIKLQLKQNPKVFFSKHEITLIQDGIRINNEMGIILLKWDNLKRWFQNDEYILLYTTSQCFHSIPKRLTKQGLNIDKIIEELTETLGKPS